MLKLTLALLGCLALLVFLIGGIRYGAEAIVVPVTKERYEECLAYKAAQHQQTPNCPKNETLWDRGFEDPVAYYTLWLAFFTVALALGALVQGILLGRQIGLAREEFDATHRPEIIVHSVMEAQAILENGEKGVAAFATYFNKGSVPARKAEIRAVIIPMQFGFDLEDGIELPLIANQPTEMIIPGKPYNFPVLPAAQLSHLLEGDGWPTTNPVATAYCLGTISYEDSAGVRRQTGFCHRWEDHKWLRMVDNSYAYAY